MNNVLGPLLNTAAEERDLLLDTLETYFIAGSMAEAAKRLFCHRNTVRHRLSRIEDLTGRSVDNPSGAVELYIAIQTMLRLPNPPTRRQFDSLCAGPASGTGALPHLGPGRRRW
jgi:DNA-binding PucR family transcriptional regulator